MKPITITYQVLICKKETGKQTISLELQTTTNEANQLKMDNRIM